MGRLSCKILVRFLQGKRPDLASCKISVICKYLARSCKINVICKNLARSCKITILARLGCRTIFSRKGTKALTVNVRSFIQSVKMAKYSKHFYLKNSIKLINDLAFFNCLLCYFVKSCALFATVCNETNCLNFSRSAIKKTNEKAFAWRFTEAWSTNKLTWTWPLIFLNFSNHTRKQCSDQKATLDLDLPLLGIFSAKLANGPKYIFSI